MKYAAVVLALAASVFGQASLADLPPCSITCLTSAVATSGCGVTDAACQCGDKKNEITASVTPCLASSCSAEDQAKVLAITDAICASAGGAASSATGALSSAAASASSALSATASASSPATQSSSAAGERYGVAGALIAGAAILAL